MRHRRRKGGFWQTWWEVSQDAQGGPHVAHDAWREHFLRFFGVAPEKHWLFSGRRFKPWLSGRWGSPGLFNPLVAVVLSRGGGLLSLYVLHLLSEQPRYGNDIMREIERRTHGHWGPNPGAVYPLLTALERRGFVRGEWEDEHKRTRKIYRILPEGEEELRRLREVMRPKLEEAIDVLRRMHGELEIQEEDRG